MNVSIFKPNAKIAASAIGLQIDVVTATNSHEIDAAIASVNQKRAAALLVLADNLFIGHRVQLAILAAKHEVPTIYPFPENAVAGGLMSYGPDTADTNRQAGIYVGRILKGEKPRRPSGDTS